MSYDDFQSLRVKIDAEVATVTIDHAPINLFDMTLIGDMDRLGRTLEADDDIHAVVLQSANPNFFIAHADVTLIQTLPTEIAPRTEKLGLFQAMCDRFRTMPKATIVKLEGACRGGGSEFALACDMRFAAIGRAVLGQPEVALGIIPGAGGCVRLPRLVGRARALEIVLGCGDFDAVTAERYGYVNRALPAADICAFVDKLVRKIASFPREAIRLAKEAVLKADRHVEDDLIHEERSFFSTLAHGEAKRRMAEAMKRGLQTQAVEAGPIEDFLLALAR